MIRSESVLGFSSWQCFVFVSGHARCHNAKEHLFSGFGPERFSNVLRNALVCNLGSVHHALRLHSRNASVLTGERSVQQVGFAYVCKACELHMHSGNGRVNALQKTVCCNEPHRVA